MWIYTLQTKQAVTVKISVALMIHACPYFYKMDFVIFYIFEWFKYKLIDLDWVKMFYQSHL